jgi:ATP-binding cassette subfamily B protein
VTEQKTLKETERITQGPGPGRGPMGGGMVGQKANTFGPSAKRLVRQMAPEKTKAVLVVLLAVVSVALMSIGPRILGRATDLIFAGILGKNIPPGVTQDQAVDALRAQGDDRQADLIASMKDLVPGQGVDFAAVRNVLLLVLAVSAGCAPTSRTRSTPCR